MMLSCVLMWMACTQSSATMHGAASPTRAPVSRESDALASEMPAYFSFVKDPSLIEASRHTVPAHDPEYDAQFDESPSWGSPAPRIEAAEGLIALASNSASPEPDVLGGN